MIILFITKYISVQFLVFSHINFTYSSDMKIFLYFLLLLGLILSIRGEEVSSNYTYEQYEKQFGRNWTGQEREAHKRAFEKNYQQLLNAQENHDGEFKVKVNNFTDMTDEQKANFLSYRPKKLQMPYDQVPKVNKLRAVAMPRQLNYSALGKVTSIKNQGKCGSCWAFTTVGMYESQLLINGIGQYDLSQQYVLQCTQGGSCSGGWPNLALNMFTQQGVPLQSQYLYKGTFDFYDQSKICSTDQNFVKLPQAIKNIKHYNSLTETQLRQNLLDNGPVSVGVRAGDTGFLYYAGGIFTGCPSDTTQEQVDHVVLLIGWTQQGNWIIKNSWGKSWGEQGYGVIDRVNNCGLNLFVDVLQVIKTPTTTDSTQNLSEVQTLRVTMTGISGNGYNGYVFGLRQGKTIMTVFGHEFTSGPKQGPIELQVKTGVDTQVVVAIAGRNSQQIGFTITDSTGKVLCSRSPGSKFNNSIIFCQFCIGCTVSATISYDVVLTDAGKNGWNGNILTFVQDGVETLFGEQFISGEKYGPRKYNFTKNVPVNIVSDKIGKNPEDIGFEIRDQFGNIAFQRKPGTSFEPDANLGSFCPGCSNIYAINYVSLSASDQDEGYYTTSQNRQAKPFIIAIAVLSSILFLSIVGIGIVYYRSRQTKGDFSKKDFQGAAMFSTGSIPDENPAEPQKAEGTQAVQEQKVQKIV